VEVHEIDPDGVRQAIRTLKQQESHAQAV